MARRKDKKGSQSRLPGDGGGGPKDSASRSADSPCDWSTVLESRMQAEPQAVYRPPQLTEHGVEGLLLKQRDLRQHGIIMGK